MSERLKVVLATPTVMRPYDAYLAALEASVPALEAAGFDHGAVFEVGNPYISAARSYLLRKAMDAKADVVVFLDHDLSWRPEDLVRLIETPGDVVAGTYRYKKEPEEYMGSVFTDESGIAVTREDGCIKGFGVPAGFLKITSQGVHDFMGAYPDLVFGPRYNPFVDLFNHGAHENVWFGEDMAFSRRWRAMGRDIWIVPDLDLTHHKSEQAYPGNFHRFLLAQPGGSEHQS